VSQVVRLHTCIEQQTVATVLNTQVMYDVQVLLALSVAHLLANRVDRHSLLHAMLWQHSIHALTFTAGQDINSHPCYLGHDVSIALHIISVVRLLLVSAYW